MDHIHRSVLTNSSSKGQARTRPRQALRRALRLDPAFLNLVPSVYAHTQKIQDFLSRHRRHTLIQKIELFPELTAYFQPDFSRGATDRVCPQPWRLLQTASPLSLQLLPSYKSFFDSCRQLQLRRNQKIEVFQYEFETLTETIILLNNQLVWLCIHVQADGFYSTSHLKESDQSWKKKTTHHLVFLKL